MSEFAPCGPCLAYRRGERENLDLGFGPVHVCDRQPADGVGEGCPCGCEMRPAGMLATDREMYGDCYLNALGGRIDPARVQPRGLWPVASAPLTWRCHSCGAERADADIDVAVEHAILPGGGSLKTSARYCADREDCEARARELARRWRDSAVAD